MLTQIRHVGIVVNDMSASLHFYHKLLGFQLSDSHVESGMFIDTILGLQQVSVVTLKLPHPSMVCKIELLHFIEPKKEKNDCNNINPSINAVGIRHIAFTVDGILQMYQKLQKAGVLFISEPRLSPDRKVMVAFCRSPEGTLIELVDLQK